MKQNKRVNELFDNWLENSSSNKGVEDLASFMYTQGRADATDNRHKFDIKQAIKDKWSWKKGIEYGRHSEAEKIFSELEKAGIEESYWVGHDPKVKYFVVSNKEYQRIKVHHLGKGKKV